MFKRCCHVGITVLLTLLTTLPPSTAFAQSAAVTVDGTPLAGKVLTRDGLTYVPLTALLSALGGWEATWDSTARTAHAETEYFTLTVPIGANYVTADGYLFGLNGDCILADNRTYVPLRAMANLFGAQVVFTDWDTPIAVTTGHSYSYTEEDLYWLSRVISAESQGESLYGQIAVGNVVLNRVASEEFPDTIRAVVFDTKDAVQFEPIANGTIYHTPTEQSLLAAHLVLNGTQAVDDCLYFFNPSLSQGTWIRRNRTHYTTIGCHRFYR